MVKMVLDDFIRYAKEQFDCEISVKKCDKPDTFDSIFGASFLNDKNCVEKGGGDMKLKEFKKSSVWKVTDCVKYVDENGVEIEPTTEVQRRKMYNMEVISHGTMINGNISTLEVILRKNKSRV